MDLMAIINLNEMDDLVSELTHNRPLGAIPFAGRYRLIDFALSNIVNSGVSNVGVLLGHKYRSVVDHLRSGKEWDLARKREGLALLPPAYATYPRYMAYRGDVENFHANLEYLRFSRQKYVVIAGSEAVCNIDFRPVLEYHQSCHADVTVVYSKRNCKDHDCNGALMLEMDHCGRIWDMHVSGGAASEDRMALGMFLLERELLIELIEATSSRGGYDFVKHCLISNLNELDMFGWMYDGYVARVNSVSTYFQHSMELLKPPVWQDLFGRCGNIYTKVKDEPPAQYTEAAQVTNSMVANGCYIDGVVENSILFRGVSVAKGAVVRNSIVMQKGVIGENSRLDYVVCDKNVNVSAGKTLKGEENHPVVIRKGRKV